MNEQIKQEYAEVIQTTIDDEARTVLVRTVDSDVEIIQTMVPYPTPEAVEAAIFRDFGPFEIEPWWDYIKVPAKDAPKLAAALIKAANRPRS